MSAFDVLTKTVEPKTITVGELVEQLSKLNPDTEFNIARGVDLKSFQPQIDIRFSLEVLENGVGRYFVKKTSSV